MAVPFIASNEFLNPATAIDLTASPKLALTNASTYDNTDNLTTVALEEVTGSGYARINLSVLSNSVQPGGDYKLIYNLAQITPSGGSITFDRVVLVIGSNWAGYWEYGTTTIASGQTYPFRGMTIQRTDQGTLVNGQNGLPAWTTTSASFVHPAAVGGTVSATVGQTSFMAVGSYLFFDDGVSQTQYKITAIGSATNVTLQRTTDEVTGGTTMQAGGTLVPSGKNGADGTDGFGLLFVFNTTTTTPPSSGQLRFNNAAPGSVTAIYASETDRNTTNISSILNGLNAGSQLLITDDSDPTAWAMYTLNSRTDSGTYSTLAVTYIGHFGTLSDNVVMSFANKGAAGADGITGFGLKYTFSATTTSPPNSGQVRLNNALPASATSIFIHETDRNSNNVASVLAALTVGSAIMILDESDPTAYALYTISSNTDNGIDRTIGVTAIAAGVGTFSGSVLLTFAMKGDTGATGSVSSATSLTLTEQGAITSTAANEIDLVNVSNELQWRLESDGLTRSAAYKDPDINAQTGTTYTLALSDRYGVVTMNNASANTVTIPTNVSVAFPIGTMIELWQIGAGATTYDADVGVTLNGVSGGAATSSGAYSAVSLRKIGTDSWLIAGGIGNVA